MFYENIICRSQNRMEIISIMCEEIFWKFISTKFHKEQRNKIIYWMWSCTSFNSLMWKRNLTTTLIIFPWNLTCLVTVCATGLYLVQKLHYIWHYSDMWCVSLLFQIVHHETIYDIIHWDPSFTREIQFSYS